MELCKDDLTMDKLQNTIYVLTITMKIQRNIFLVQCQAASCIFVIRPKKLRYPWII